MLPTALLSFPSARDSNPDMRLHLPRGFLAHQAATENLARQWIERIRDFCWLRRHAARQGEISIPLTRVKSILASQVHPESLLGSFSFAVEKMYP